MCVAQQILSVGTMKSLFSFLSEWLLSLHMSLSVKTTWPGGSVIRYGTYPSEDICTRGTGCGGKGGCVPILPLLGSSLRPQGWQTARSNQIHFTIKSFLHAWLVQKQ